MTPSRPGRKSGSAGGLDWADVVVNGVPLRDAEPWCRLIHCARRSRSLTPGSPAYSDDVTHDRLDYDGEGLSEAQVEGRSPLEVARDWVDAAVARQAERGDVPEPLAISIASVDADGAPNVRTESPKLPTSAYAVFCRQKGMRTPPSTATGRPYCMTHLKDAPAQRA